MAKGNINIEGVVNGIKNTSVYFPILEGIVNSIHAIDEVLEKNKNHKGEIIVKVKRLKQQSFNIDNDSLDDIESFEIIDNGIGFNKKNLDSFETYLSDHKKNIGGKGYGRFLYLKFFNTVKVESIYEDEGKKKKVTFDFDIDSEDMLKNKTEEEALGNEKIGTKLFLNNLKRKYISILNQKSKTIDTLSRKLLEHLLIYFIDDTKNYLNITVTDGSKPINLRELIGKGKEIEKIHEEKFKLENKSLLEGVKNIEEDFNIKIFKVSYGETNIINLCADNRVVIYKGLSGYIPDFGSKLKDTDDKNYIINVYITGDYLNKHVDTERDKFDFFSENNEIFKEFITEENILNKSSQLIKNFYSEYLNSLNIKKEVDIKNYISEKAPWYSSLFKDLDLNSVELGISEEKLDEKFHKLKFVKEKDIKAKTSSFLKSSNFGDLNEIKTLVNGLDDLVKTELAHYVATRKITLDILEKALEFDEKTNKYVSEDSIHSIIFPTKTDSDTIEYKDHNLWILDEKLTFTEYISSDKPLNGGTSERCDIVIFDKQIALRGDNKASNPITIFEFKKPSRDDFVNESSNEDPIKQIIRYVNSIRDGKYKTPKGRVIDIAENTPFYGYIVCTFTPKVKEWLVREKDFTVMPDGKGYFNWMKSNNLYIEVLSWDKILDDSKMRNKIFFDKLKFN